MGKLYDRRRIILNLFKGILDKFSGAVAGYSLRRLSKWKIQLPSEIVTPLLALSLRYVVTGYTGDVIRVRRSSDNAELDYNPTEITDGTLLAWVNTDVVQFQSNFIAASNQFNFSSNITLTTGETIGGESNCLKAVLTGGNVQHLLGKNNAFETGQGLALTFDIYIPSSNSAVNQIFTERPDNLGLTTPTQDTWVTVLFTGTSDSPDFRFYVANGGSSTVDADGDVIYMKNITLTQTTADGAVTKIYDQSSGGDDMVQATASKQGIIVDAGVLNTEGGKPIIHRSANNNGGYLSTFQPNDGATVKGVFYVGDNNSKSVTIFGSASGSADYGFNAISGSTSTAVDNNPTITASFINGVSNTPATRGAAYTATNLQFLMYREIQFNFEDNVLGLGYRQSNPSNIGMFSFQELIICDTDGKGGEMEFNINAYYDIYEQWDGISVARVRRSSDNAELDFKEKEITDGTLTTWTGSANGFVTTWYDQSGNGNDAVQTVASKQPMIVDAEVLVTVNGKPAILADGVNDSLQSSFLSSNPNTQFIVYDKIGTTGELGGLYNNNLHAGSFIIFGNGIAPYQNGPQFGTTYLNNNQALVTLKSATSGINWELWGNGTSVTNSGQNIGTLTSNRIKLFSRGNDTAFANTYLQEYILYNFNQTANRVGIETNINNHYSIY